jgi:hypothetical protein
MAPERLNELKCQLDVYGGGLSTSESRELIAEVERLQAFANLACKLYPALSGEWEAMREGV